MLGWRGGGYYHGQLHDCCHLLVTWLPAPHLLHPCPTPCSQLSKTRQQKSIDRRQFVQKLTPRCGRCEARTVYDSRISRRPPRDVVLTLWRRTSTHLRTTCKQMMARCQVKHTGALWRERISETSEQFISGLGTNSLVIERFSSDVSSPRHIRARLLSGLHKDLKQWRRRNIKDRLVNTNSFDESSWEHFVPKYKETTFSIWTARDKDKLREMWHCRQNNQIPAKWFC